MVSDALDRLHRSSVKTDLRIAKILQRLEIDDASDEEIDTALDEQ
jgi:phosphoribosylformylglycinamidine (FGAM) synthase PurS component